MNAFLMYFMLIGFNLFALPITMRLFLSFIIIYIHRQEDTLRVEDVLAIYIEIYSHPRTLSPWYVHTFSRR